MLNALADERDTSRSFLGAGMVLMLKDGDPRPHAGLMRDVSDTGMFFYSDISPACGSELHFEFKLSQGGTDSVWLACQGRVVRVEQPTPGAAVGVAISVQRREVLGPLRPE